MIQLYNQIPEVYYKQSRDFQFIGRLFDLVLNAVKTNADMLYQIPNGLMNDTQSTEVLAHTLGFKIKHDYDKDQLAALVSIFPTLLKYKGTVTAIKMAGDAMIRASNVIGDFQFSLNNNVLEVILPYELTDMSLFQDLLPYILPAGISCSISRGRGASVTFKTKLATAQDITAVLTDLSNDPGLSTIAIPETSSLTYTYKTDFIDDQNGKINTGLIGNTVIQPPIISDTPQTVTVEEQEDS